MIVVADSEREFRGEIAAQLGRSHDLLEADGLPEIERLVAERAGVISLVLIGPSTPTGDALKVAEKLQVGYPDVSVVVVARSLTADLLQAALRAGVRDVLPDSFSPQQLVDTVSRAEQLARQLRDRSGGGGGAPEPAEAKVVTVFSSKGGCGKSFVSSNLAVLLAQKSGREVAMVDLDLQFGDLAIMLQLFPARTIFDASQHLDRLDAEALRGYLTPHRSLVYLLAAPLEPGLAETISAEAVKSIMQLLKQSFRYIVVDTPPSFTDHVLAALDESDECVLLTSMDVPSIKNLKLSLQTLELLGFGRNRVRLVLNRADSKVGLRVQEVEKTLGTTVDVAIPSSREVPLSINRGAPLVTEDPRSPVVSAIGKIADAIAASEGAASESKPAGRRFGKR